MAQPVCNTSTCAGHALTFSPTASNGTNYAWDFGDGGSSALQSPSHTYNSIGNFTVSLLLTDGNGCVTTTSQLVCVYPVINTSLSSTNPVCSTLENGSIDLTVTGGAPSATFTYVWSNGQTTEDLSDLAAGTYSVTVSDGITGCTQTTSATLTNQTLTNYAITASGPTTFCLGGSVTLSAGAGFASYLWSTGASSQSITVSTSGTYSVTVSNSQGCQATDSEIIVVHPLPIVSITQTPNSCTGVNVTLNATTGYVSYLWNNGSTTSSTVATSNGNYRVTVTDFNGCTNTANVSVTPGSSCPTPTGLFVTAINVPNATLNWTAAPCAISYRIQYRLVGPGPPGTTINIAAPATSVSISGLLPNTTYEWRIRSDCGSGPLSAWSGYSQFSSGSAKSPLSSAESTLPEATLFPNPNDGKFTVTYHAAEASAVEICIWDLYGKKIFCEGQMANEGESTWKIDLELANGVYFFSVEPLVQGKSESKRIKFVVE